MGLLFDIFTKIAGGLHPRVQGGVGSKATVEFDLARRYTREVKASHGVEAKRMQSSILKLQTSSFTQVDALQRSPFERLPTLTIQHIHKTFQVDFRYA